MVSLKSICKINYRKINRELNECHFDKKRKIFLLSIFLRNFPQIIAFHKIHIFRLSWKYSMWYTTLPFLFLVSILRSSNRSCSQPVFKLIVLRSKAWYCKSFVFVKQITNKQYFCTTIEKWVKENWKRKPISIIQQLRGAKMLC